MDILDIKDPSDIKHMSQANLKELSFVMREFLINSISKTGGHLGSSLGAVELIMAIHYVFNSPEDKIVFDVGHQAYAHKLLTARADKFHTLRQYKGLSGFLKKRESIHDVWESGHAANSISAAIGYAMQRDLDHLSHHVIAVIGDGSMTNGMSLEALNHLIEINKRLIIIINDNEMSISPNIGFIDKMFKSLEVNQSYDNTKKVIKTGIDKIDGTHKVTDILRSFKNKIKTEINQTKGFFNLLGFKYLGPIDGHNLEDLIKNLELAKTYNTPLILHVKTIKGKGYAPAQDNMWHGVGKFDVKTGKMAKSEKISNSKVISKKILEIMELDKDIVIITPAMIAGSELKVIQSKYPNQITDVGIAEEHAASLAAGLALAGKKPFLSIYSTFLQRAYDQVFQDIVRQNADVVIGIDRAGLVGADGETHHGIYDISFLLHMPGITLMQGKDPREMQDLLELAFSKKGPMFLRYSRHGAYTEDEIKSDNKKIQYGTWDMLSKGSKLNIITYGEDVDKLLDIYKDTKEVGIINARFIKPLDEVMLNQIKDIPMLVVEEAAKIGGLGNFMLNYFNEQKININLEIMAIGDSFVEHGEIDELKKEQKIDIKSVEKKVRSIING